MISWWEETNETARKKQGEMKQTNETTQTDETARTTETDKIAETNKTDKMKWEQLEQLEQFG